MPKGLVENLAKSCVLTVYRAYYPELVRIALEEGLYDGLLFDLLTEAEEDEESAGPVFSNEDANNLQTQIDGIGKLIDGFEKSFAAASEVWKPVIDGLRSYAGELPDMAKIVDMINSGDAKAAGKASADYTQKLQTLTGDVAAIIGAVQAVQTDLANFKDANKESTIAELANASDGKTFPKLDQLDKGIQAAYQIPAWFDKVWASGAKAAEKEAAGGGFFQKAMSFIGGLFKSDKSGRVVEAKTLADAIKGTPLGAFLGVQLEQAQKAITTDSEQLANNLTQMNTGAQGGGDAGAGDQPADPASDPSAAVKQAAKEPEAPGVAIANALDAWKDGLASSSQKTLMAQNRFSDLKVGIDDTLSGMSKAVEKQVRNAIKKWKKKHVEPEESPLNKKKQFSLKNWDSLEELIPQLASTMMQKKNESTGRFTTGTIHRAVYRYLDDTYLNNDVIFESRRWGTLAGIGEDNEKS